MHRASTVHTVETHGMRNAQVPPQRFLFEAAVDGDALMTQKAAVEAGRGVDDADLNELAVTVWPI